MKFTDTQQKAIDLKGDSLLVSAAAGSGKTAVLTERVIQKITADPPTPIESLMILTFTTAAADEMRSRISKKLRERLADSPTDPVLRRQLSMLPSAQISTIHSACFSIVCENFEALGLDPMLSIADESQTELMKADTLLDFVEELYQNMDSDADAKLIIDSYYAGKNDNKLFTVIEKGSEFLSSLPFPTLYDKKIDELNIIDHALLILSKKLSDIIDGYGKLGECGDPKIAEFADCECMNIRRVYNAVTEHDYTKAYELSKEVTFARFSKPKELDKGAWEPIKADRARLKELTQKLFASFLPAPEITVIADRAKECEILHALFRVCTRFNQLLLQKRLKERSISYNDLEQFTLKLLVDDYDGVTLTRSETAKALSEKYSEIIVDEYQDCNLIQELIFIALSKEGKNIFTVGDVKQSIYRFRNAQPQLFLDRQKNSSYPDGELLTRPSKLDLSCNFRSHPLILEYINKIFYMLMTKSHSIDYTDGHALVPSDLYGESNSASVELSLYVTSDSDKNTATRIEAEAAAVAKKIKSIIGSKTFYDVKNKTERLIRASDIALIMRAPKSCGAIFELALEREGISCINNNPSEKYLDTKEVRDTLALLQTVDNPYDDVPLITAMHSEYFDFDANELASVRSVNKRVPFFDALKEYAKTDKKSADFINIITELRTLTLSQSVYGIIMSAYEKTSILTRFSAVAGGDKKRANLLLLAELASGFEQARYRGLFAFITYLIKLSENDSHIPPSKLRDSTECVNLLSIHKSKGLEFPVVFFVNTTANLPPVDYSEVMHNEVLGPGSKLRDSERHCEFSSLARNIIIEHERKEDINEYIRLLYVALTRAGSHLYVSGALTAKNAVDMIVACESASSPPTLTETDSGASFFKWMLMPYINTRGANALRGYAGFFPASEPSCFTSEVIDIDAQDTRTDVGETQADRRSEYDFDEVMRLLSREVKTQNIPKKLSVSEIKASAVKESVPFKKPRFLTGNITGADVGNATHKFLQFCDFHAITDSESFEKERQRLVGYEFISQKDAELVDGEGVITFMNDPTLQLLLSDYTLEKEERFMFTLEAREIMDTDSKEQVLIQGVLDCLFVKGDTAVIVDYKTDRVKTETELVDRYKTQLDMYTLAIKQNRGLSTEACYIYSFALKKFIQL